MPRPKSSSRALAYVLSGSRLVVILVQRRPKRCLKTIDQRYHLYSQS